MLDTHVTLGSLFASGVPEVMLLDSWDRRNRCHVEGSYPNEGMIRQSKRFNPRSQSGVLVHVSLILDAKRPLPVIR